ncbi:MAG: hypothetical protein OXL96_25490 [Candidatus Poribacteria bacterium]|nr:hypothetical protein [Candidatus Poribacteria bacterium]
MIGPLRRDVLEGGRIYEYVSDSMADVVRRHVAVSHAPNVVYTSEHLNNGLLLGGVFSASSSGTVESARQACARMLGREAPGSGMPCGEWQRMMLARLEPGAATAAFFETLEENVRVLRGLGMLDGEMDLAVDMHLIPRYDAERGPELVRSKNKSGTTWFERYITIQSVTPGLRLVLGALPMPALGEKADFVRQLVHMCKAHGIRIGVVMADREFFATGVIRVFEDEDLRYLVSCRNTGAVVDALNDFAGHAGFFPARDMVISDGRSEVGYIGRIVGRRNGTRYGGLGEEEDGGSAPSIDYWDPSLEPCQRYIMFATNDPELDVEMYAMRWGIETGYRMIENARPKTRSTRPEIRAFCFLYGVMMFNAWVMINVQRALQGSGDLGQWDGTPLITQNAVTLYVLLRILGESLTPKPSPQPPPESPG